ncbi:MAG: hypothetical protein ABI699_03160 [Caldimonas sp.]
MMLAKFTAVALLAAASAGFSTEVPARPVNIDVQIGTAPPALRYEAVPAPRRGYVWAPGYWNWRNQRHHWVAGNWVRHRQGYVYTQPAWVQNGDRWRLNRGAWARGDTDHDGIPNSRDRDRDGDGIRNRYDRDRDGDGVRNRYDRQPDNPRRH